ncbi:kinase domain-containing protein [Dothidotthia symphoricarpi CBS 119687]|uniref:Kinase domain-containing protein n=1 Tax=Dothidotthia symphoricarpi CBS 119687 TaxID=1392245 RepID=A0A6A6A1A1_9PLEO|nr:kinase domain-containing protein [Dothidotthia symphoricarpi CBS 119687]KAF2124975.1 kinase domain-containing protein [Dothidotthia symphoricarpi CBS 119687]
MAGRTHAPSSITEDPDRYEPNGLHPILIGDELQDGRYRIVHKLGMGSFSTVWLARDTKEKRYVSLKVLAADTPLDTKELGVLQHIASSTLNHPGRQYVIHLLDEFIVEGPNGKHRCLVTEVAGERLAKRLSSGSDLLEQSRTVGLQLAQALGFLHAIEITHGDCYTSNILMQLAKFDDWADSDVYEVLGQPIEHEVRRLDGAPLANNAPKYTVKPGNIGALEGRLTLNKILLIDFGESFYHHERPEEITTPAPFASPEIVFGTEITPAIDNWAFACILYELAADHTLFKMIFGWFNDTLKDQVAMLGKPPDAMWEKWGGREKYFHPDGTSKESEGRRLKVEPYPLEQRVRNIGKSLDEREYGSLSKPEKPLSAGLQDLYDLLRGILSYVPESRTSFEHIQEHPFFYNGGSASL